jgi:hypothetical protein
MVELTNKDLVVGSNPASVSFFSRISSAAKAQATNTWLAMISNFWLSKFGNHRAPSYLQLK